MILRFLGEKLKVNNKLPKVKILSETKINPQSLDEFMEEANITSEWSDKQTSRNLNEKLSDLEKFPEVIHCLRNEIPTSTFEFNKTINRSLLKNIFVSIGLLNVSQDLVFEISQTTTLQIQTKHLDSEISFWVNPCLMDNDKAAIFYGMAISETSDKVDELRRFIENVSEGTKEEKDRAVKKLYPMSSQIHCIISGSLYDWQKLIYEGTDFNKLDELRFVLIELTKKLKLKFKSLFYNFILVNEKGEEFGLDTVNSEDNAWRRYKVKIRGL